MDGKLNALSGGLLLTWAGFVLMFGIGWGPGLVFAGMIVPGEQIACWKFGVNFDKYWVVFGIAAVFGGTLIWFGMENSLIPVLFIAFGIAPYRFRADKR